MATHEFTSEKLSDIYRRIDELKDYALKDPTEVQMRLPSILDDLKACLEEQSVAYGEIIQVNKAIKESEEDSY
jgi:hypothetical protein